MQSVSCSALAANIAAEFGPEVAALADILAWRHDGGDPESYPGPGWDDPEAGYDPTPEDWREYAAWSRDLDGGCGVAELSPDEMAILAHSAPESDYWEAEMSFAEYDAARDAEEVWL